MYCAYACIVQHVRSVHTHKHTYPESHGADKGQQHPLFHLHPRNMKYHYMVTMSYTSST